MDLLNLLIFVASFVFFFQIALFGLDFHVEHCLVKHVVLWLTY